MISPCAEASLSFNVCGRRGVIKQAAMTELFHVLSGFEMIPLPQRCVSPWLKCCFPLPCLSALLYREADKKEVCYLFLN